jgi:hypothetical protein
MRAFDVLRWQKTLYRKRSAWLSIPIAISGEIVRAKLALRYLKKPNLRPECEVWYGYAVCLSVLVSCCKTSSRGAITAVPSSACSRHSTLLFHRFTDARFAALGMTLVSCGDRDRRG